MTYCYAFFRFLPVCCFMTALTPVAADVLADDVFSAELVQAFRTQVEQSIEYNRFLGLKLLELRANTVRFGMHLRPELRGHLSIPRIHGGAISGALDAVAGAAVMAAVCAKFPGESGPALLERAGRLGTIDLRVDYLRQGLGEYFEATGQVMRLGSRVASVRMEFLDAQGQLLSTGTAAYIVS